ncbi:hypothetical protein ACM66B_002523 [Microbotryomycetes sp. NB124-2]
MVEHDDPRLLDEARIHDYRDQIYGPDDDRPLELKFIATQLVEHALAVDNLLQLQKRQMEHKLEQAKFSAQQDQKWHAAERERWQAEKDQLTMQAYALAHKLKLAQQHRPTTLDRKVDEYGHVTVYVEQDDSRHSVELRNMQRRLQDSEAQVARLQAELKKLRPFYLHASPLVAYDAEVQIPQNNDDRRIRKAPTLGDAEAEHLILAGKTLSHVRRINRVPLSSAIVQQAEDIVARSHLAEDDGEELMLEGTPREDVAATPKRKSRSRKKSGVNPTAADAEDSPNGGAGGQQGQLAQSPSRPTIVVTPSRRHAATAESGGAMPTPRAIEHPTPGRLDDLLQAAQTVETGSSPHHHQFDEPSTVKRRRLNTGEASPTRHRHSPWRPSTSRALQRLQMDEGEAMDQDVHETAADDDLGHEQEGDGLTALDVLAQASASQHATSSQTPPPDDGDDADYVEPASFARPPQRGGGTGLSSAATLNPPGPSLLRGQSIEPRSSMGGERGGGGSGTGSPLAPGIDINSLGNGGTPKPLRSPYIKWNVQEDEQLLNAVIKHGLRWDQVSAEIPTRSYHQVRQRFLRGLKNGKNLPSELGHLGERVRETVKLHEDKKKSKKDKLGNAATPGTPGGGGGGGGSEMLEDDEYLQE